MAARSIGHMDPCDENKEYWCTYSERLEQFFDANDDDIKDPKKVSSLITFLGSKTYKLLKSLTTPAKPAEKSYDDLVKILSGHLAPEPILVAESFKFYRRDQAILFKKILYFKYDIKCDSLIHGSKLFYFSLRLSSLKTVNSVRINTCRFTVKRGNLVLPNDVSIARATNIHVPSQIRRSRVTVD